jgi:hypothetical protein
MNIATGTRPITFVLHDLALKLLTRVNAFMIFKMTESSVLVNSLMKINVQQLFHCL